MDEHVAGHGGRNVIADLNRSRWIGERANRTLIPHFLSRRIDDHVGGYVVDAIEELQLVVQVPARRHRRSGCAGWSRGRSRRRLSNRWQPLLVSGLPRSPV